MHAARDADAMLLVEADYVRGIAALWQGEFVAAREHFAAAVDRYRPEHRHAHLLLYGSDPKVICLSRLGNTLWFLGCPEAATRARDAALALADEIEHPYSRSTALVFAAMLSLEMRALERVRTYAVMLAAGRGYQETRPTRVITGAIAGYIDVLDGRQGAGIARIQCAPDDASGADHAPGMRAVLVRLLLEACAVAGDARTGLAAADRALAVGNSDRLWEAETRRLRAEFLTAEGAPAQDVEAELGRALDVARGQRAMLFELRAAVSLLRFRLERGDPATSRAREQLAAIAAALPEGRDSWDVREAVALLDRV